MYQFHLLPGASIRGLDGDFDVLDFLDIVAAPLWRMLYLKKLLLQSETWDSFNTKQYSILNRNKLSYTSSSADMLRRRDDWSKYIYTHIGCRAKKEPLMRWDSHLTVAVFRHVMSVHKLNQTLIDINRRIDELTPEFRQRQHVPQIAALLELNASETYIRTNIATLLTRYVAGDRDMLENVQTFSDNREKHELAKFPKKHLSGAQARQRKRERDGNSSPLPSPKQARTWQEFQKANRGRQCHRNEWCEEKKRRREQDTHNIQVVSPKPPTTCREALEFQHPPHKRLRSDWQKKCKNINKQEN
jgi:hypothetical protein